MRSNPSWQLLRRGPALDGGHGNAAGDGNRNPLHLGGDQDAARVAGGGIARDESEVHDLPGRRAPDSKREGPGICSQSGQGLAYTMIVDRTAMHTWRETYFR